MLVPMMISNMAAGNVSIQLGARGKCTDVVTACASGTHSIGDAFRAIQYGDAEVMIAGGTENAHYPHRGVRVYQPDRPDHLQRSGAGFHPPLTRTGAASCWEREPVS